MKVVMTGGNSTTPNTNLSLAKWVRESFDNVIHLSRSTGYDFYKNYHDIVKEARTAELFINYSCVDDFQIKLLEDVYDYVPNMLVFGSIAGDFPNVKNVEYSTIKHNLKNRCKLLPLERKTSNTNLLHLTLTSTEYAEIGKEGITKNQLTDIINFWLENPIISNIDIKIFLDEQFLTSKTFEKLSRELGF
jgi:hypothetical protein